MDSPFGAQRRRLLLFPSTYFDQDCFGRGVGAVVHALYEIRVQLCIIGLQGQSPAQAPNSLIRSALKCECKASVGVCHCRVRRYGQRSIIGDNRLGLLVLNGKHAT